MKKYSAIFVAAIAVTAILSGCDAINTGGLSESEVREIVKSEFANDEFKAKVQDEITAFVKAEEEKLKKAQEEANKPKKVENVSADDDPVIGNADAPVTIIEFSEYECPFCGRHFSQTYPQLKSEYIDTGKVKLVFRDFPLEFHQNAMPAAVAANCAREQGDDATYFEYHDKLFENQQNLNQETFISIANELELNASEFTTCLDSGKFDEEIEKDISEGATYGVSGTPAFFINGWLLSGAQPFDNFKALIDQELGGETAEATESPEVSPAVEE